MKTSLLVCLLAAAALAACGVDSTPQSSGQSKSEATASNEEAKKPQ